VVGKPVARRPPHRSQRAELPHWSPALGKDAQTLLRIRMTDLGVRKPAFDKAAQPLPVDSGSLTPPVQPLEPKPTHIEAECIQGSAISFAAQLPGPHFPYQRLAYSLTGINA
jgi:hypothetical protein